MSARGKSLEILGATRLKPGAVAYVRQQEPMGLGHAVWCARRHRRRRAVRGAARRRLHGRPAGCLRQMVEAYNKTGGNLICAMQVADDATDKYGIITPGLRDGALTEVQGLVEKPRQGTAPSNLAVIGRYILQPEVMRVLEGQEAGAGGEIQLTDAMARMIGSQAFHAVTFGGTRYDCGDKAGFIQANIAMALGRDDIGPAVRAFIDGARG
jgi:UTP--glucose-1-phosphate uridylyltransferase